MQCKTKHRIEIITSLFCPFLIGGNHGATLASRSLMTLMHAALSLGQPWLSASSSKSMAVRASMWLHSTSPQMSHPVLKNELNAFHM
jgi:hypothetical protein